MSGRVGETGNHIFHSCMCDHLRPRGVLSAYDLLAVGNGLEGHAFC